MNQPWKIEMLGGLRATQGELEVVRFKTHKTAALLAYLALHPRRTHTREFLIDLLWPDADLSQGRPSLSVALSSLRHQFEPPGAPSGSVIIATNSEVRLNPAGIVTDVDEFEKLASAGSSEEAAPLMRAAELYRGELLPGHYEEWCSLERERLRDLHVRGLRTLVRSFVRSKTMPQAIDYATRAVAADPLQEELHRDLMQLLAATGQISRALRQYRELEETLARELGSHPSATVRKLADELQGRTEEEKAPARVSIKPTVAAQPSALPTGLLSILAVGSTSPKVRASLAEIAARNGHELAGSENLSLFAFAYPSEARDCAVALAKEFEADDDALKIAIGVGEGNDVAALAEFRIQMRRWLAAAHPGQILCSEEIALLLRRAAEPGSLAIALGRWRLDSASEPDTLFEVLTDGDDASSFPPPNALPAYEPELPLQFTRFFGREAEMADVLQYFQKTPASRLLTLTGPGGAGKTRLAIESARKVASFMDGAAWFAALADVSDPDRIIEAILDALNVTRPASGDPLAALGNRFGNRAALLILDNAEQIVEGVADVVSALLVRFPELRLIVTSRQKLNLGAEREMPVPPLAIPTGATSVENVANCDSVRLFVDRARVVKPDFQVTAQNAAALSELCDRLEGLPLAIELAASRAQGLAPSQMIAQLADRFTFLTSRRRDLPERHRMMRAAIEWSVRLLDPATRAFFNRLSIFRGGWTLEQATEICGDSMALDTLCLLQECSLITTDEASGDMRCKMLESLRVYGDSELEAEERDDLQKRHAAFFGKLAQENGADDFALEAEHENLRHALDWLLDQNYSLEAIRMVVALSDFWERRGWLREGASFLNRSAAQDCSRLDVSLVRPLLSSAGWFAYLRGRYEEAERHHLACLQICFARKDADGECIARNNLGLVSQATGRNEMALEHYGKSLEIARSLGNEERVAARLSNLALLEIAEEDYRPANERLNEALSIYQSSGNAFGVAACLCNLGKLSAYDGRWDEAVELAEESLGHFQEIGERSGATYAMATIALGETLRGNLTGAEARLKEAMTACEEAGLDGPMPFLLETWARNAVATGEFASSALALACADRLREAMGGTRTKAEAASVEEIRTQLQSTAPLELRTQTVRAGPLPQDRISAAVIELIKGSEM